MLPVQCVLGLFLRVLLTAISGRHLGLIWNLVPGLDSLHTGLFRLFSFMAAGDPLSRHPIYRLSMAHLFSQRAVHAHRPARPGSQGNRRAALV